MEAIKRVTLIGLGAMGAVFAPGLSAVLGEGFRVMAQGARRARLEEQGVTINGTHYRFPIVEPGDRDGPSDLVIVAVKDYALEEALEQIKNQVGPDTLVMPVLNGLTAPRRTGAVYGMERVLYASMWIAASMENGVATFGASSGLVRFGLARNDPPSPAVERVAELFQRAGIRHEVPADMLHCIWLKFMGNVSENLPCALLGVPYGAYHASGDADAIRRAAMEEVAAVAKRAGVELTAEDMALRDKVVSRLDDGSRPSTLQDLDRGRPTEVDLFAGEVVRLGEKYGVPTPVCRLFYHGIRVLEQKNAGEIPGTERMQNLE